MKNETPKQRNEQVERMLEHTKEAIKRGELDHTDPDQSISGRYGRSLYRMARDISEENTEGDFFGRELQSAITMLHTLYMEGRIVEVNQVLHTGFPEYYSDMPDSAIVSASALSNLERQANPKK